MCSPCPRVRSVAGAGRRLHLARSEAREACLRNLCFYAWVGDARRGEAVSIIYIYLFSGQSMQWGFRKEWTINVFTGLIYILYNPLQDVAVGMERTKTTPLLYFN